MVAGILRNKHKRILKTHRCTHYVHTNTVLYDFAQNYGWRHFPVQPHPSFPRSRSSIQHFDDCDDKDEEDDDDDCKGDDDDDEIWETYKLPPSQYPIFIGCFFCRFDFLEKIQQPPFSRQNNLISRATRPAFSSKDKWISQPHSLYFPLADIRIFSGRQIQIYLSVEIEIG